MGTMNRRPGMLPGRMAAAAAPLCALVLALAGYAGAGAGEGSGTAAAGVIFARREAAFSEGEGVFDVLSREMRSARIHLERSSNPAFDSVCIEGDGNLCEFDCGDGSGRMYSVNGWIPNYGCSRYAVAEGDEIVWSCTCELGEDLV